MSKIEINKLTNANVYMNGANLLGRAEEVQLPQVKHKMAVQGTTMCLCH